MHTAEYIKGGSTEKQSNSGVHRGHATNNDLFISSPRFTALAAVIFPVSFLYGWCIITREFADAHLWPFSPELSKIAAADSAWPLGRCEYSVQQ